MDPAAFVWPPAWSIAAFLVLMAGMALAVPACAYRSQVRDGDGPGWARVALAVAGVCALNLVLAAWWPWQAAFAPGAAVVVLAALLPALWFGCGRAGAAVARSCPLWLLVGIQGFRLPLELLLHVWVDAGSIPSDMTWTGRNWDVVTGGVALIAASILAWQPGRRWLAWLVQGLGLLLLAQVMVVVLRSAPLPWWSDWAEPPLILVAIPPLSLIGPLAVGSALAWHLVAIRALRS